MKLGAINYGKVQTAFKNGTLLNRLIMFVHNNRRLRIIKKPAIRELVNQAEAYNKFYKYVNNKKNRLDEIYSEDNAATEFPRVIWWCWLQGTDSAPVICQKCLEQLRKVAEGYEIKEIDETNIELYVTVPDFIMLKYKQGIIGPAAFSDILRLLLLEKWGGVWIDSTVYATGEEMFKIIEKCDVFFYKAFMNDFGGCACSSWLIGAKPGNRLIRMILFLLTNYWKENDVLYHYYGFHMLVGIISDLYPALINNIPTFSNVVPHIMASELSDKYSYERYKQLVLMSDFHKLSYRVSYTKKGTLFDYLFLS